MSKQTRFEVKKAVFCVKALGQVKKRVKKNTSKPMMFRNTRSKSHEQNLEYCNHQQCSEIFLLVSACSLNEQSATPHPNHLTGKIGSNKKHA